ncbi:unnamed protein product [Caenorhabditis nigoni]
MTEELRTLLKNSPLLQGQTKKIISTTSTPTPATTAITATREKSRENLPSFGVQFFESPDELPANVILLTFEHLPQMSADFIDTKNQRWLLQTSQVPQKWQQQHSDTLHSSNATQSCY